MAKQFSPVVYAECRFAVDPRFLHVGVWFKDKQEIDNLINAMVALRNTIDDDFDHIHLQQHGLSPESSVGSAEVMFFRPGRPVAEDERQMIDEAKDWIGATRTR